MLVELKWNIIHYETYQPKKLDQWNSHVKCLIIILIQNAQDLSSAQNKVPLFFLIVQYVVDKVAKDV